MKKIILKDQKGMAPIVVAIIVGALVVAGVAAYLFIVKPWSGGPTAAEESLDALQIESPTLDLSLSPMPALKLSSINLAVISLPALSPLSGFSLNTDFSYKGSIDISTPSYDLNSLMSVPEVPVSVPSGSTAPAGTTGQAPSTTQQTDCSAFSSAPSCSYVGAPGSQAYDLCKQCYPNR